MGGLTQASLMRNKYGKIVSKEASAAAKKRYQTSGAKLWAECIQKARKSLNLKGFVPINGKVAEGKFFTRRPRRCTARSEQHQALCGSPLGQVLDACRRGSPRGGASMPMSWVAEVIVSDRTVLWLRCPRLA